MNISDIPSSTNLLSTDNGEVINLYNIAHCHWVSSADGTQRLRMQSSVCSTVYCLSAVESLHALSKWVNCVGCFMPRAHSCETAPKQNLYSAVNFDLHAIGIHSDPLQAVRAACVEAYKLEADHEIQVALYSGDWAGGIASATFYTSKLGRPELTHNLHFAVQLIKPTE